MKKLPRYSIKCRVCAREFESKIPNKIYCSMACYKNDPIAMDRLAKQSKMALQARIDRLGHGSVDRVKVNCANCGKELLLKASSVNRNRNYCNASCYRHYQAARFDRWIASPQTVALPQNYDEFLDQEELPCIIEGCNWIGIRLCNHVNLEHGIDRNAFKMLAGFNIGSGLVPPQESERLRQSALARLQSNGLKITPNTPGVVIPANRSYISLESKEHISKAQSLMRIDCIGLVGDNQCRYCLAKLPKIPFGLKLYCSPICRQKYYDAKRYPLVCFHCGNNFDGRGNQELRNRRHMPVFCSGSCKGAYISVHRHQHLNVTTNHEVRK